jgi:type IV secretory pathway VirB10-like protein
MAENPTPGSTAPIIDHRSTPRGVLPRHVQTWLMAALAGGILLIILVTGRPEAPTRPATTMPVSEPAPERVRDYQDRLRAMEARAAQEAAAVVAQPAPTPAPAYGEPPATRQEDPIASERKRRDYESLFASNMAFTRRPESQRAESGRMPAARQTNGAEAANGSTPPSIDEIADAVVRAATRASGPVSASVPQPSVMSAPQPTPPANIVPQPAEVRTATPPISAAGPVHRVLEGTIIDTVLTNRLDGSGAAPVNCLVTNPVYSHSGQHVLIPAGSRVLGETKPVQGFGESRLAVAFHRVLLPDGRTETLDQFLGLNQIGDAGLRDRVNNHYWSTFGAAAAVGLIGGLAQAVGTAGFGGDGDRTVIIAGSAADSTSQASLQVMNRFLNRLPTITIREGHRVKVYLTSDLELPAYTAPATGK